MTTIYIEIPIPPKTKKNHPRILKNRRTGKSFVAPSEQYENYERDCAWFIQPLENPISYAVNVRCIFYMPDKRRCDLTNLLESIDDILVKYGVLADDNYSIVAGHDGSRVKVDKENPRTEIYIEDIKDDSPDILIPVDIPLDFPNGL